MDEGVPTAASSLLPESLDVELALLVEEAERVPTVAVVPLYEVEEEVL